MFIKFSDFLVDFSQCPHFMSRYRIAASACLLSQPKNDKDHAYSFGEATTSTRADAPVGSFGVDKHITVEYITHSERFL